ncbi:Transducin (beta)-like 3 [Orobanche gracilis]
MFQRSLPPKFFFLHPPLLATGGNEGKLRLFDVDSGSYTHGDEVCRQCVSYVMFHPDPKKKLVWVISTGKKMKQIATVDNMCSPLTSTSIAVSEMETHYLVREEIS